MSPVQPEDITIAPRPPSRCVSQAGIDHSVPATPPPESIITKIFFL